MPRVSRLSIAPVRSLGLEHPDEIVVTEIGVVEDRRFFLADESNRLVDRLIVGELVRIATHTDPDATMLRMTFPDGRVIEDEVRVTDPIETPIHGRTGVGHVVDGPWAAALSAFCGRPITLVRCDRPAGTRTGNPTSLIGDGSLDELAQHAGVPSVDGRRFRMLIEFEGAKPREEDAWIGHRIAIGGAVLDDHQAGRPLRDHDPGPGHRRPRPRHPAHDHLVPRPAGGEARRPRGPRRCRDARHDPARRRGPRPRLTAQRRGVAQRRTARTHSKDASAISGATHVAAITPSRSTRPAAIPAASKPLSIATNR